MNFSTYPHHIFASHINPNQNQILLSSFRTPSIFIFMLTFRRSRRIHSPSSCVAAEQG
ncbi:hypothetical protein Scep_005642 [Stephania cephalantha]|uniref:Uncharacterized protein n=1 Tax=Stephania cephalantha TaxID=152367 RepID=A0AAP0PWJ9_9MAGN